MEQYRNKIRPYLQDIINCVKESETWKIQLIANKFISPIDDNEESVIHSKNDNIKIMINDESDEIIKELFDPLKKDIESW